mgnify:CR=1 FL=1
MEKTGKEGIEAKLREIIEVIIKKYNPDKIILFGSYAYGTPKEESDIDLLIVKETDEPFHRRWANVCSLVSHIVKTLPFSPFVVTPKELKERLEIGDQFFIEISNRGRVLYAK